MIYSELGDSLLLRQFRDFYTEIIRLKALSLRTHASAVPAIGDLSLDMLEDSPTHFVHQRLLSLLDHQQRSAIQLGSEYWTAYEEARYIMVVLADEIFLHSEWEGRFAWNFNLIEEKLFQTRIAGDLFFQHVDALFELRDPTRVELAKIYLMALALGFQGRYRGSNPDGALMNYRRRLYAYIFQNSQQLRDEGRILFPDTLRNTLDASRDMRKLPPVRKWLLRFALIAFLAFGVQQIVWRYVLTPDVRETADHIISPPQETTQAESNP